MPDDLARRYTTRQIAEVMAYYRIKEEDRADEEARRHRQMEIEADRAKRRGRRR